MCKCKILCVDDEDFMLECLQGTFYGKNYELLTAKSGFAGLVLLSQTPGIQVVISDYRMPGMTGIEFLREVSSLWPEIVRIITSGAADPAEICAAIDRGDIYRFMAKPWNPDELLMTVADAFENFYPA